MDSKKNGWKAHYRGEEIFSLIDIHPYVTWASTDTSRISNLQKHIVYTLLPPLLYMMASDGQ